MQVKPVKTGKAPTRHPLPTAAEVAANPDLVDPAPSRAPRGIGVALGAGLVGSLLSGTAGCQRETPPPPAAALDAERVVSDADAAAKAEAARQSVVTFVAPMLQKALDEDGRGGFGCVAVDPPFFLSENEALDIIEQEFAKAGVKLRDCYELTGFTRHLTDWNAKPKPRGKNDADASEVFFLGDGDPCRPQREVPGRWLFDFATEDGSILVEFLSTKDHDKLKDVHPGAGAMSSVQFYDLPHRAARFREELETRTNGAPVTIALFFDPMAKGASWKEKGGRYIRPDSAFKGMTLEEYDALGWEKREELKRQDSRRLLLEQIRFFLDWAKKEGKLPAP